MSARHDYRLNPFHLGMELLADAQGGRMLDVGTDNTFVYGFAAAQEDTILLYLINKTENAQELTITLRGASCTAPGGRVMRDTPDHWGDVVALPVTAGRNFTATLPALSYCRISFTRTPSRGAE